MNAPAPRMSSTDRRGFSLVEVVVSLTLLAVTLAALARPTYSYARNVVTLSADDARNAIIAQQLNRLSVLPFDSLPSRAGCQTLTAAPYSHTRCITVTDTSVRQRHVVMLITPTNAAFRAGTAVIDRTRSSTVNPFDT